MKKKVAWMLPVCALAASVAAPIANGQADVALCDIHQVTKWGTTGPITAYSIGTTSVNVGTTDLNWISNNTDHPVIGQTMYKILDGRIEQIGQSWLKHGFCALQIDSDCDTGCPNQPGCLNFLAPGCEDPYSAPRNGSHSLLGPKYQVDPHEGTFTWPHPVPPSTTIGGRLQVHNADLGDSDALYLVEGQYVARDDALAGNQDNNASYRLVTIGSFPNYFIGFVSGQGTEFKTSAITAWQKHGLGVDTADPDVVLTNAPVPNEGLFILGHKVTDNGDGTWHYEYALQNLNSHRSAREFIVPVGSGVIITNVGFHDVDYHSGDGEGGVTRDGTDWSDTVSGSSVSWSTQTFAENDNANALRWGTLYNFRFDADTAPEAVTATIGLYRKGDPTVVTVETLGPSGAGGCPWDCEPIPDGIVSTPDLLALLGQWLGPGSCEFSGDGFVSTPDLLKMLGVWGPCP